MKAQGTLGKLITLGSILNLIAFAVFIKAQQRSYRARRCTSSNCFNHFDFVYLKIIADLLD